MDVIAYFYLLEIFYSLRSPGSFQNETDFHPGMRLEAVDVYNPSLLRVASVVNIEVDR